MGEGRHIGLIEARARQSDHGRIAGRAPGSLRAEAGTRAAAPFPPPLSPLAALFLRCAPDKFSLTKPNTSCTIEMPASLRSEGVRVHPGMPFGFLSESAFGFAGILSSIPPRASKNFWCR